MTRFRISRIRWAVKPENFGVLSSRPLQNPNDKKLFHSVHEGDPRICMIDHTSGIPLGWLVSGSVSTALARF